MGFFKTLTQLILKNSAITIVCIIAFCSRLYSVVKYEAIVHEFDPYFNFRATKYLVEHGPTAFMNWFDPDSWYPLGRNIGTTVYPGLMFTSAFIFKFLAFFNLIIDVRIICVLMGPIYSFITCICVYHRSQIQNNSLAAKIPCVCTHFKMRSPPFPLPQIPNTHHPIFCFC